MRYTVIQSEIQVVGHIWQPIAGLCAMVYQPSANALREGETWAEEGPITRESVQRWIDTHTDDFSVIVDWTAEIEDGDETILFEWQTEQGEIAYMDIMFGGEH